MYPRPQLKRESFFLLNGQWDFAFDDENIGVLEGWSHTVRGDRKINVPSHMKRVKVGSEMKDRMELYGIGKT